MEMQKELTLESQRSLGSESYGKRDRENQRTFPRVKFDGTGMKYIYQKIFTEQLGLNLTEKQLRGFC